MTETAPSYTAVDPTPWTYARRAEAACRLVEHRDFEPSDAARLLGVEPATLALLHGLKSRLAGDLYEQVLSGQLSLDEARALTAAAATRPVGPWYGPDEIYNHVNAGRTVPVKPEDQAPLLGYFAESGSGQDGFIQDEVVGDLYNLNRFVEWLDHG